MKKITLIVMGCTIISQILGFARDMLLSFFYGTTAFSDAFLISLTIVTVLYSFVIIALSTSYIPMYREIENKVNFNGALIYTKSLIKITLIISFFIVVLVFFFTEPLVNLFSGNLGAEEKLLTLNFVKIGIFNVFFTGLVYIFSAFLQLRDSYIAPALIGVPFNLAMIIGIVLSYTYYEYSLAIAISLSAFGQLIFLIPFAKLKGFKWIYKEDIGGSYIKKTIILSFPIVIGASINDINITFNKILASNHIIGGVSAMNYSDRLIGLLYGLFISTIIAVVYPKISKEVVNKDVNNIKMIITNSLLGLSIFLIPASIGYMILNNDIVSVLYGRGMFNQQSVEMTAGLLFYFALGIVAVGYREVFSRVFYAYQDTKTPVYNALIAIVINVFLSLILKEYMGINGLALAISISAYISVLLLYVSLKKKIKYVFEKEFIIAVIKICIASILMGGCIQLLKYTLFKGESYLSILELISCIIVGVGIYVIIMLFSGISIINNVKRKIFKSSEM